MVNPHALISRSIILFIFTKPLDLGSVVICPPPNPYTLLFTIPSRLFYFRSLLAGLSFRCSSQVISLSSRMEWLSSRLSPP